MVHVNAANVGLLLNEHEFIQMHSSLGQTFGDIKCHWHYLLQVRSLLSLNSILDTGQVYEG